jgi:hypothetical protein
MGSISLWISFAASIFFAHKKRTTPRCSIVVHVFRGAAICNSRRERVRVPAKKIVAPPPPRRADQLKIFTINGKECHDNWVPVTRAWRVLGLRMKERPSVRRVAANIFNNVVADSRHGVVVQLRGWAKCWQLLAVTTGIVTRHEHLSRTWTDTSVRPKQRRRPWDSVHGMLGTPIGQVHL